MRSFFIKTLILLLPFIASFSPVCSQTELGRYTFTHKQMGTIFRIILYAADSTLARSAATEAFSRIDQLNDILSDYKADSEVNQLSAKAGTGELVPVSPDLWTVLSKSLEAAKQSKGAFDITVGPYVKLWRRSRRQGELPGVEALAKAKKSVGHTYIKLFADRQAVQLLAPGMQLDLGGIGKGYAVDEAMKILQKQGIKSALVDGGGNIIVTQAPPGQQGWQVEIGSLTENKAGAQHIQHLTLTHQGMASSGDVYQYVEINGIRYSHIVNPHTGIGLTNQDMVTVIAPDGTTADILSTSISVLGLRKGAKLLKYYKVQACFVQKPDGSVEQWKSE